MLAAPQARPDRGECFRHRASARHRQGNTQMLDRGLIERKRAEASALRRGSATLFCGRESAAEL